MKISSVIKIAILFAVFYYVIMFINTNQFAHKVYFPWFGTNLVVAGPLWSIVGISLAIGFLASAFWMLGKTVATYFSPSGKLTRSMKKVEEKYYYGIEALSKGDDQSAVVFFEEILTIDPDNFRTLIKYGELLRETDKHQRAISLHQHALSLSENNVKVLHELAVDYKKAGDIAKAKEMLERIIEISPKGNNAIYRELRDILVAEAKWERALEIQRKLVPLVVHNGRREAEYQLLSGLEYEVAMRRKEAGDLDEATDILKGILKRNPSFLPAQLELGACMLSQGAEEEAVEIWLNGYYESKIPVLLGRLEEHFLDSDNPNKAIEMYHKVIAKEEEDLLPKLLLGKLFYRLEMVDRAIAIFEEIDSEFEFAPVMSYFMGKIQARKGENENAVETFRTLIRATGILEAEFICTNCEATYRAYQARCSSCRKWDTIRLNVRKGKSLSEMDVASRPVYQAD